LITKTLVTILNQCQNEFVAVGATEVGEAMAIVQGIRPDLVVLDVSMPGVTHLEHAIEMRERWGCRVLLMSGQPDTAFELEHLFASGGAPFEILAKPIHPAAMIEKIREMLANSDGGVAWTNPLSNSLTDRRKEGKSKSGVARC
jgi:DNA-binding response OmpR family regulator